MENEENFEKNILDFQDRIGHLIPIIKSESMKLYNKKHGCKQAAVNARNYLQDVIKTSIKLRQEIQTNVKEFSKEPKKIILKKTAKSLKKDSRKKSKKTPKTVIKKTVTLEKLDSTEDTIDNKLCNTFGIPKNDDSEIDKMEEDLDQRHESFINNMKKTKKYDIQVYNDIKKDHEFLLNYHNLNKSEHGVTVIECIHANSIRMKRHIHNCDKLSKNLKNS